MHCLNQLLLNQPVHHPPPHLLLSPQMLLLLSCINAQNNKIFPKSVYSNNALNFRYKTRIKYLFWVHIFQTGEMYGKSQPMTTILPVHGTSAWRPMQPRSQQFDQATQYMVLLIYLKL